MIFAESNKVSRSAVLVGCFLFTSCLCASVAQSTEQAQAPGKNGPPSAQSQGSSPFSGLFLLEAGYTYTHWNPEKISGTEVETQGLNLAWIELQSQTIGGLAKYFSIPRMRFETSLIGNYITM